MTELLNLLRESKSFEYDSKFDQSSAHAKLATEIAIGNRFSCAKLTDMDRRRIVFVSLLSVSLFCASCATSLFKVKPATALPPMPSASHTAEAGGVTIRVAPLLSDEEIQELFEANLPVGGVLPVRVELNFQSGAPIELKRVRFKVQDNQNKDWKLLSTKQAVSRIMKANEIFAYNPYSKKQFEQDFGAYALDLKTPIESAQPQRRGFLFFQTPDNRPVSRSGSLKLIIEKLPIAPTLVTIPLN